MYNIEKKKDWRPDSETENKNHGTMPAEKRLDYFNQQKNSKKNSEKFFLKNFLKNFV